MFDARTSVRFWTKVAISAGGCAEWTGATYPNGYGEFHCNGYETASVAGGGAS